MRRLRILSCALLVAAACTFAASAHSWYPKECCSDGDCMPADGIYTDIGGNRVVTIGHRRVWVPLGFAVRTSPDDRIHVCFTDDAFGVQAPRCVFMPAEG